MVIPCYNESSRIGNLLKTLKSFDGRWNTPLEILLVDDGSTDGSPKKIEAQFSNAFSGNTDFRFIQLPQNLGKGGALKAGVAEATGDYILTLDADMATRPQELDKWLKELPGKTFHDDQILIGSREHENSNVAGNLIRRIAGLIFNFIIQLFTNINFADTQCGFKLYPAAIAKKLFGELKTNGWAHDVELLYNAQLNEIDVQPMPVKWIHQEDSKINLVADSFKMLFQTLFIAIRLKFKHYLLDPIRNFGAMDATGEPNYYRLLFTLLTVALLVGMPMLSYDFGFTGDEKVQKIYGEKILNYFETDGEDKSALDYKNLYYYGGLFDYAAAWVNKHFGGDDPYETRHLLNALVGFIMIFFTGKLARELSGSWRIAFFALAFMALSPRIFGHSMNNPKDIPFAAAYVFTLLYMVRFMKQLPRPGSKTIILLTLGIAAAINVRVGGILLIAYFGLFTILTYFLKPNLRSQLTDFAKTGRMIGTGLFVAIGGFFAGMIFWPYARQAPFSNPFTALSEMSNFSTSIRMLFEGNHMWSDELPWYYIPKWILISAPIFTLIGIVLFLIMLGLRFRKTDYWPLLLVAFTAIFPVTYAVLKGSSLYDGMRHFLFIYPVIAALAAWGWGTVIATGKSAGIKYGVSAALVVLMALPTIWMVKNHPYQYTYFNELAGGTDAAYARYETDYWMVSMKPMVEWLIENDERIKKGETVKVLTNCYDPVAHYFKKLAPNVKVDYTRYRSRHEKSSDYFMLFSRFVNKDLMASGAWPPGNVIYEETVDGIPVGVITKRDTRYEVDAFAAEKKQDYATAKQLYTKETQANPKNELAWWALASVNTQLRDFPGAQAALNKLFELSPTYQNGWFAQGILYYQQQKIPEAIEAFNQAIKYNYKYTSAYYYLAVIYAQQNQAEKALKAVENFDKENGSIPQAYDIGIKVAQQKGDKLLENYFSAKKAYFEKDYQKSYQLIQQALLIDSNYEPAVKLKEIYDKAFAQQGAQQK